MALGDRQQVVEYFGGGQFFDPRDRAEIDILAHRFEHRMPASGRAEVRAVAGKLVLLEVMTIRAEGFLQEHQAADPPFAKPRGVNEILQR